MERWKALQEQMGKFWTSLSMGLKVAMGAAVALILAVVIAVAANSRGQERVYLYENLTNEDNQAITAELNRLGVKDYIADGTGIKVMPDQVMPLRLKLAQEGLPSHGQIGWEKFDQQDFTRTEFEQNIHKMRAMEGELARTIIAVDGVMSARVHLVVPKQALFGEDKKEPTAAIYIKTKRGVELSEKQIRGIVHLTSRSVEGLSPEKVTVIDHEGKMLTKMESEDPTTKRTTEMVTFRRTVEKDLEDKVRTIVARVVGPDRVEAKVDVEVDFTEEEQVISDIDPDRVAVLSSDTSNNEMSGSGLNPTGIPGSKSNVPGEQEEVVANSNRSNAKRGSERINYEIAKTQSKKLLPVGNIKRISAAVIVDGGQPYPVDGAQPVFQPRTPEEMTKINELVKSAIGFKEGRDEVKVHNMMFQLAPYQMQVLDEKKQESREYISNLALSALVALSLILFFVLIVRPYFRWLSYDPQRKQAETLVEEYRSDLEMGGIQNVHVKEEVPFDKLTPQEQIHYLAKHEPQRTTEALRILLSPHANH